MVAKGADELVLAHVGVPLDADLLRNAAPWTESSLAGRQLVLLNIDPAWGSIREDRRFANALKKVGLP